MYELDRVLGGCVRVAFDAGVAADVWMRVEEGRGDVTVLG